MHGNSPEFVVLVNAEVDSMGGVIDGGVGIDSKISPRRAAIDMAQAQLRVEYDVREERRRELEFLEKGGNPLDFKLGPATSISVQSTSVADQFVTSEAKDSFPLTASPRGDSVESSGRPGAALVRDTNTADNLLLFDGENDTVEGERNSKPRSRSNIAQSEQVSQMDGYRNVQEPEDTGMLRFVVKNQAYARRNRSRSSRDSVRGCSTDFTSVSDRNGSSVLRSRPASRDTKGIVGEASVEKDQTVKSVCNLKSTNPNGHVVGKNMGCDNQLGRESDVRQSHGTASGSAIVGEGESDVTASKRLWGRDHQQRLSVDADKCPKPTASMTTDNVGEKEGVSFARIPLTASAMVENVSTASQCNGFGSNVNEVDMLKEGGNHSLAFDVEGIVDPESCIQNGLGVNGNTSIDQIPTSSRVDSPRNSNKEIPLVETSTHKAGNSLVKEKSDIKGVEVHAEINDRHKSVSLNSKNSGSSVKVEEETGESRPGMKNELKFISNLDKLDHNDHVVSNTDGKTCDLVVDGANVKSTGSCPQVRRPSTTGFTNSDQPEVKLSGRGLDALELQIYEESQLKLAKKMHEDSIMEEARSIEAKRKRIAELSVRNYPSEYRRKSHWDFVLEEMAWLANDFMQERLWKTSAASQISHMAASNGRLRISKRNECCGPKQIAHTLTKAIMQFWRSAEEIFSTNPSIGLEECTLALVGLQKVDRDKVMEDKIRDNDVEASRHMEEQNTVKCHRLAVQEYAVRFLKYSSSFKCAVQAEAPKTPDRLSDLGIVDIFMEDRFSEEILFYTAPPGAMEAYRKSVENYWSQYEKTGGSTHTEEVETSIYGASEELGTRDNLYEEDEGEAGAYYFPGGFEASKLSKSAQKKRKNLQKSYARSYDVGADLPYGQFVENKVGTQNSLILGKRPPNNLNVGSIPIKRVRTASRQRVVSAGVAGGVQIPCKADASSGDTSSYQDDQSIVHGGSHIRKTLEVESTGDYGEQLPFDCTEVSMKPRKKKKAKHLLHKNSLNSTENGGYVIGKGPPYEQRWQLDSMVENEQRDYSKKRLGSHVFESNGNSGVFGQHATKRPKILKQLQDTSESITPVAGTVPSPVASQMSNMSNPNKFMKMITGRDRGRKIKALKTPAGQSGSGSPWSLFEDQALVVLVHDMGPNWELVSDAVSSTLQFKCIYRNPKECKERHKILMDRNAGDGADSAEDSGSSQPYPSTLPGIPKGSARQLFQRLQGPMEEDTLKSHFEKIIMSVQKQHPRRTQSDKQGTKLVPVHNSHIAALSQVSPNNLSGGILTPLDLCDTTTSSSDLAPLAYQGSHSSGLPISNQGPTPPVHPTSGANSMLQGSAAIVHDNSLPSPSAAFNTSSRDGQRYGVPRPASVSNNENQKMQPYNQMLPSKNIQLSGVATPGSLPSDRGVRMLPGANSMGMMTGIRGMTMPRPGFQGIGSPAMLNMVSSGTMLSSSGVGIPNPVNMHNGAVSGQGNSMMRTREALHMNMMRAPDEQRQLMMQELQMQVTQGNSQGIPPFNGLSSGYTSQTVSPPSQTFPVQHPQQHQIATQQPHVLSNNHHPHLQGSNHTATPQQQAYLLRIAKERQLHQRAVHQHNQQQQHQFASSNTTMTHVQPQSQHPVSSSLQNSSQIQQASSQPVSVPPPNVHHPLTSSSPMNPVSSQSQQKQLQMAAHGLVRNPQAVSGNLPNQILKQRQRQQQQQQQQQHPGRHHPQQRQQSQPQQQTKLVKGMGRGNIVMHQNISLDASHVNGLTMAAGNQVAEKGEQVMHLLQGQSLFSGSGSTAVQTSKPLVPQPSSSSQQKLFSRSPPSSSKQVLQMPSPTDNSNQGQVHPVSSGNAQQPVLPLAMPPHQQQSLHRQASQSQQTIHRMLPQNRQASSDSSIDQVNQLPVNDSFHMSTSTDSTSVVPVTSSSTPPQWKAQEPFYDASTPNAASQLASIGNPSLPSSSGDEPITLHSQGISQRQFSGGIPIHNQNVQTQWQPQKQPLLQSSQQSSPPLAHPPPPSQQPQLQSQAQPQQPPQQHSPQNSQVEQGGLCVRPTNSGPG